MSRTSGSAKPAYNNYSGYITNNKDAIKLSDRCICIYCLSQYPAASVNEFTSDHSGICPECGVDSVIPDATKVVTHDELYQWHLIGFKS